MSVSRISSCALASLFFLEITGTTRELPGHVPPAAAHAQRQGRAPAGKVLNLAIGLPLRDPEGLANFLKELYDPARSNYHKYLTTAEFTARFGPTAEDYAQLIAFARSNALTITTHPNRMILDLRGNVGQIEKAFHITLGMYRHPVENRSFFAPDHEPIFELDVPILHISGLDNYQLPRPAYLKIDPLATQQTRPKPRTGSGPNGTYIGRDFRAAYAPGVNLSGAGQYVGLLQFDGYYPGDIAAYTSQAGMTNVPLINVLLDGLNGSAGGNNIEVALDIEMAMSMAPGLSGIIVYEGDLGNDILNRMATDNLAKQLSASWAFPGDGTTTQIFQEFAAQGQSFFHASGDDGAYNGSIDAPSDNPYIISVGGTTLSTRGAGGGWLSETTWSWISTGKAAAASGGGISPIFSIPAWQQGIDMSSNNGSTYQRNIPDVAMVADNVLVRANNGGQTSVGGTSISAPLWAGFMALINQQAAGVSEPPAGFINPAIYALSQTYSYASAFHDIKTGNNTNSISPTLFFATNGYDLCTGLGTPVGQALINALAPLPNSPFIVPLKATLWQETCWPANGVLDPGEAVAMYFALQNRGRFASTNLIATLQADNNVLPLSDPQSYGAVSANGGIANRQFAFIPTGACGDTIVLTLHLQDGTTDFGTVTFTNQLGVPQVTFSQAFDDTTAPALPAGWMTTATGGASNWVVSTMARDSAPNSLKAFEPPAAGVSEVVSPSIAIQTSTAQLTFRNNYNTEVDVENAGTALDGGVLEISISGGPYTDILDAGGTFVMGGYTRTINSSGDNPLDGRLAWAGLSPGFIPTVVNLPAVAAGQNVQFRWRFGTDSGHYMGGSGWYIDTVQIIDGFACCASATSNDLAISQTVSPNPGAVGQPVSYFISVTNFGPGPAPGLSITDALPSNVAFLSATDGCTNFGNYVVCKTPLLTSGATTNFIIQVTPAISGIISNAVTVSSTTPDLNLANNWDTELLMVYDRPVILDPPTSQVAIAGADAVFNVNATGAWPLLYQWTFWGTNLPGETGSTLLLPNVQPAQSGPYAVAITNSAGFAISDSVTLRVLVPATIQSITPASGSSNSSLSFNTVPGLNYWLEYKNALSDASWTPIWPVVTASNSWMTLADTNAPAGPGRFYRVNCN